MIDVEIVCETMVDDETVSAQAIADSVGQVFHTQPGRTWVRLHVLNSSLYAENGGPGSQSELPAFATALQAHPPAGLALASEVAAVTEAIAKSLDRPIERVHVQYAPAAAGRQAFGGRLVE